MKNNLSTIIHQKQLILTKKNQIWLKLSEKHSKTTNFDQKWWKNTVFGENWCQKSAFHGCYTSKISRFWDKKDWKTTNLNQFWPNLRQKCSNLVQNWWKRLKNNQFQCNLVKNKLNLLMQHQQKTTNLKVIWPKTEQIEEKRNKFLPILLLIGGIFFEESAQFGPIWTKFFAYT